MKKIFLTIFTLLCLHIHASAPSGQFAVILYRGEVSSVIIDTDELEATLSASQAIELVGTGSNKVCLGRINMVIANNTDTLPHNLELLCNTYNTTNNEFVAIHTDNSSELTIGIEKDFNVEGQMTGFTFITPTSDTTLLRTSDVTIAPSESYTLYFYILQSPHNTFLQGTYTGNFVLYFSS